MCKGDRTNFGYAISRDAGGWRWVTLDDSGTVQRHGRAPDRACAAAHVIRALLRRHDARSGGR